MSAIKIQAELVINRLTFIFTACVVAIAGGCSNPQTGSESREHAQTGEAIANPGNPPERRIDDLLQTMQTGTESAKIGAMDYLGKKIMLGELDIEALDSSEEIEEAVIELVTDESEATNVRIWAVNLVGGLPNLQPQSVEQLTSLLLDDSETNDYLRRNVGMALSSAASRDASIKDALLALLMDSEAQGKSRELLLETITYVANFDITALVAAETENSDAGVRGAALRFLQNPEFAQQASRVDAKRVELVISNSEESLQNRIDAAIVLSRIASFQTSEGYLEKLTEFAESEDVPKELRVSIIQSLPFASNYSDDIRSLLTKLSSVRIAEIAVAAEWAIEKIDERREMRMKAIQEVRSQRGAQ